jgi:hypothetical protein
MFGLSEIKAANRPKQVASGDFVRVETVAFLVEGSQPGGVLITRFDGKSSPVYLKPIAAIEFLERLALTDGHAGKVNKLCETLFP